VGVGLDEEGINKCVCGGRGTAGEWGARGVAELLITRT